MFLTRHFVYVHVPRTGGNFVRVLLEDHAPADWQVQRLHDHTAAADTPASHAGLPHIAFVRNPYAWYVSWFHFQQTTRDPFFLEISKNGSLPFAETMRRVLRSRESFRRGDGPYTQTLRALLGDDLASARIGRVENLRHDLLRLLSTIVDVPPAVALAIRTLPQQNTSPHEHWARYFDDDLREQIAQKDREAMAFFGYGWGTPPAIPPASG